jgi:hypothetical protein
VTEGEPDAAVERLFVGETDPEPELCQERELDEETLGLPDRAGDIEERPETLPDRDGEGEGDVVTVDDAHTVKELDTVSVGLIVSEGDVRADAVIEAVEHDDADTLRDVDSETVTETVAHELGVVVPHTEKEGEAVEQRDAEWEGEGEGVVVVHPEAECDAVIESVADGDVVKESVPDDVPVVEEVTDAVMEFVGVCVRLSELDSVLDIV